MNIASSPMEAAQARSFEDGAFFDVLIVGAGISGIDAAYHLQQDHPERSFAMIERQDRFGGTCTRSGSRGSRGRRRRSPRRS